MKIVVRMIEIAGPDPHALYFGVELDDSTLVPGDNLRLGWMHYDDWLKQSARKN